MFDGVEETDNEKLLAKRCIVGCREAAAPRAGLPQLAQMSCNVKQKTADKS